MTRQHSLEQGRVQAQSLCRSDSVSWLSPGLVLGVYAECVLVFAAGLRTAQFVDTALLAVVARIADNPDVICMYVWKGSSSEGVFMPCCMGTTIYNRLTQQYNRFFCNSRSMHGPRVKAKVVILPSNSDLRPEKFSKLHCGRNV